MSDSEDNPESSDQPESDQKSESTESSNFGVTPESDPIEDEELLEVVNKAIEKHKGEDGRPAKIESSDDGKSKFDVEDLPHTVDSPASDRMEEDTVPEQDDDVSEPDEQFDGSPRDESDTQASDEPSDDPDATDEALPSQQLDESESDDSEEGEKASEDSTEKSSEPSEEIREEPLLRVEGLKTYFYTKEGEVPAVDGVDFEINAGETLGLVGESGSGKSVSALSILRLVPDPPGKIVDGNIEFEGRDLTNIPDNQMQEIRGNDISMIFQEPMTSLNPVYTVGNQIVEAITLHRDVDYAEAREMAIGMLEKVGIPAPRDRIDEYPHQMSGGMKQRVMIAMALACNPKLLIADEPTTALDVTIQAQILELLQDLQDEFDMSVLFITHDLGVIAETCDYVAVMYGGRVVEYGDVETIFEDPSHPYTIGLFSSLPQIDVEQRRRKDRLYVIPGMVPSPQNFPSGCRFRDRCDYATEKCAELPPNRDMSEPGHNSLCWYAREVREGTKEKTGPHPEDDTPSAEAAE